MLGENPVEMAVSSFPRPGVVTRRWSVGGCIPTLERGNDGLLAQSLLVGMHYRTLQRHVLGLLSASSVLEYSPDKGPIARKQAVK